MPRFEYLKKAECYEVAKIDDVELYNEVVESFETMKFSKEEQNAIWQTTAASLILGNVIFDESTFDGASNPCSIKDEDYVKRAAKLLCVTDESLSKCLRNKAIMAGKSRIESTMKL